MADPRNKKPFGDRRPRMRDIADWVGVSAAAVSLALRDNPRISAEMRTRIQAAAKELGYVYDRGAANLRTGRSRIIGVMIPDMRNPAFIKVLRSVAAHLNARGRMLLLCDTGDSVERQDFFCQTLSEYSADGVILCPALGTRPEAFDPERLRALPAVCFARHVPGAPVDSVINDDIQAFVIGTRHLLDLGHWRIAFIGGQDDTSTGRDRREGYARALAEAGLPFDPALLISATTDRKGGFDAAARMLAVVPRPTAAICFGDVIALGLMLGLRRAGIEPGKDFSVVGCDAIEEAELWQPRLTTLRTHATQTGERVVDLLFSRQADPSRPPEKFTMQPELAKGNSCGQNIIGPIG